MPASNAKIGLGARFGILGSGGAYAYIAEVVSVTPPGWTRDAVDVTHLGSDDGAKEFIAGLVDGGEASITINYLPGATGPLMAAFTAARDDFRVLFPGGAVAIDFAGVVTGFEIGDLAAGDKISATFTVKPSGLPVLTAVA